PRCESRGWEERTEFAKPPGTARLTSGPAALGGSVEHAELDPSVQRPSRFRSVVRDRLRLAVASRDEAARLDALRDEELAHGLRTPLRELQVVVVGAGAV